MLGGHAPLAPGSDVTASRSEFLKINLIHEKKKHLTQLTSKEEKTSNVAQLLISNQKCTGENQVTRRFCSRPRHFQHLPHQRRVVQSLIYHNKCQAGCLLEVAYN